MMMIIIMILPIVMIGFDAMDDLLDQWTPRAPTNIESFSLFNDFAIQLSIISFIKSWHAHTGIYMYGLVPFTQREIR